jgi:uncharacterized protein (DUF1501 family)
MSGRDDYPRLTRRRALASALGLGVSLQFLGARAFASAGDGLSDRKLVVIICRGGLDGLSLSPPVGDPNYAQLRGAIAIGPFGQPGGALKLDETFGLHPAMTAVHGLALKGQARIAPAVATPDRERSHFEAQDVLEGGSTVAYGTSSGWLNRALEAMGPPGKVKALSLGPTAPLLLRGRIEAASWSPGGLQGHDTRLAGILHDLYASDPLLGPALAEGVATQSMAALATSEAGPEAATTPEMTAQGARPPTGPHGQAVGQARRLGATLAGFLTQPGGAQVAGLEIDGFDTHANQGAAGGLLATRLAYLDAFLDGLEAGLSGRLQGGVSRIPSRDVWRDTVVVVATEFGRTARVNGTAGTDHGTGSTSLVLGGALKPGGIIGDWPTLAANRLFENRDTTPTLDMRGLFKGVLRDHLGIERSALDSSVFPDSGAVLPLAGMVA